MTPTSERSFFYWNTFDIGSICLMSVITDYNRCAQLVMKQYPYRNLLLKSPLSHGTLVIKNRLMELRKIN